MCIMPAIGSVSNFIREINNHNLDPDKLRFYRGQPCGSWDLIPSLLRPQYECIKIKEKTLLKELKIRYPDLFLDSFNLFEDLVLAQHYGIPTRLLDITSNPLVALYFACINKEKKYGNGAVYIIDISKTHIKYFDESSMLIDLDKSIMGETSEYSITVVKAKLNNPRIISQSGAFLLFNALSDNNLSNSEIKIKLDIHNGSTKRLIKELRELGISNETLFPELSMFAEELRKGNINF